MSFIFPLLIAFQIKHYLVDFVIQDDATIQGKGRPGGDFIGPLSAHAWTHASCTLLIALMTSVPFPISLGVCILDFAAHFVIDRIKASPQLFGRYEDPRQKAFWNTLGVDQLFHHLTHYLLIGILYGSHLRGL